MSLVYQLYKSLRKLVERSEKCCEKEHGEEPLFKEWKMSIETLDASTPGLAKRYEEEKKMHESFNKDQVNFICYQIGDWYLMMKPLLEGQHNLGFMKEKLKTMICGDE